VVSDGKWGIPPESKLNVVPPSVEKYHWIEAESDPGGGLILIWSPMQKSPGSLMGQEGASAIST